MPGAATPLVGAGDNVYGPWLSYSEVANIWPFGVTDATNSMAVAPGVAVDFSCKAIVARLPAAELSIGV
jgi:hypothetical protein